MSWGCDVVDGFVGFLIGFAMLIWVSAIMYSDFKGDITKSNPMIFNNKVYTCTA